MAFSLFSDQWLHDTTINSFYKKAHSELVFSYFGRKKWSAVELSQHSASLTSPDSDFYRFPGPGWSLLKRHLQFLFVQLSYDAMWYLLGEKGCVAPTAPAGVKCLEPGHVLSLEACENSFCNCVVDLGHLPPQDFLMHTNPLDFCKMNHRK